MWDTKEKIKGQSAQTNHTLPYVLYIIISYFTVASKLFIVYTLNTESKVELLDAIFLFYLVKQVDCLDLIPVPNSISDTCNF